MDSPLVAQLFRQLFRHRACHSQRNLVALSSCIQHGRRMQQQRRAMATRPTVRGAKPAPASNESDWQQRTELFAQDKTDEYKSYPTVTAMDLRTRKERPRRVKMLMRDFIEGMCRRPWTGHATPTRPACLTDDCCRPPGL